MHPLQRFKFLLLPFLLWTVIGTVTVVSLRWFLEYLTGFSHLNQAIWNYWIPFLVAVLIWFFVLRKRFKLFYNRKWQNNQEMLIFLSINVFLGLVIMFSGFALEYSYLKKESISNIHEINSEDWNTCYEIDSIEWNTDLIHAYNTSEVSGKHSNTLHYYAYFVAPLNSSDFPNTILWIGKHYHISFSNGESNQFKHDRWNSFHDESLRSFQSLKKEKNEYLYPVQQSGKLNHYMSAIQRTPQFKDVTHRVFEFSSQDLHGAAYWQLIWGGIFLLLGMASCYFISLLPIRDKKGLKNLLAGKYTLTPVEHELRNTLLLKGEHKAMASFSYLILLIYIVTCSRDGNLFYVQSSTLFDFGAMQRIAIDEGQYWRMISAMFLHIGLMHLLNNLTLFVIFGYLIEPFIGSVRFVGLVILAGLGGSVLSYSTIEYTAISLGASGIVFGLFGWYLVAPFLYKSMADSKTLLLIFTPIMVVNFLLGFILSDVDNAGHFGGFLAGVLLAFLIRPQVNVKSS